MRVWDYYEHTALCAHGMVTEILSLDSLYIGNMTQTSDIPPRFKVMRGVAKNLRVKQSEANAEKYEVDEHLRVSKCMYMDI